MYETIIAEYLDFKTPAYVRRQIPGLRLPMPAKNNLVHVITGVRRCGKTFYLYQLMDELERSGVDRRKMLHLSFDDDRFMPFADDVLSAVFEEYLRMVPEAEEGCYLFFDEVQEAPFWTNFVRRVSEQHAVTVVLTGSSSRMLSTDIPTNFRGRSLAHEMWPLSFAEFCDFHGISREPRSGAFSSLQEARLADAFQDYLEKGGFPGVQGLDELDRVKVLQSYASQIVAKDVMERFGTTSFRVANRVALTALRSTGLKFSVNKQAKDLRSSGISVATASLYALLDDLQDAHLMYRVRDFTYSVSDNPKSSAKIYSVDPGLSLAMAPASHMDVGQRFETAVYLELMRRYGDNRTDAIASYSAADCPEVDFVVGDVLSAEPRQLFQVAVESGCGRDGGRDSSKTKSEVGNLEAAMRRTGLETGTLITLREEATLSTTCGIVNVVPAWKWFLGIA